MVHVLGNVKEGPNVTGFLHKMKFLYDVVVEYTGTKICAVIGPTIKVFILQNALPGGFKPSSAHR
jgi:hypothetical protein